MYPADHHGARGVGPGYADPAASPRRCGRDGRYRAPLECFGVEDLAARAGLALRGGQVADRRNQAQRALRRHDPGPGWLGRFGRARESSRTNADDRLPVESLGRVEGGDGVVEGRDVADDCPQSSVPHPLDDLTELGAVGHDDEVDRQAGGRP